MEDLLITPRFKIDRAMLARKFIARKALYAGGRAMVFVCFVIEVEAARVWSHGRLMLSHA